MTATGAVITKDVQEEALAIARVDQVNKPRWRSSYLIF